MSSKIYPYRRYVPQPMIVREICLVALLLQLNKQPSEKYCFLFENSTLMSFQPSDVKIFEIFL